MVGCNCIDYLGEGHSCLEVGWIEVDHSHHLLHPIEDTEDKAGREDIVEDLWTSDLARCCGLIQVLVGARLQSLRCLQVGPKVLHSHHLWESCSLNWGLVGVK